MGNFPHLLLGKEIPSKIRWTFSHGYVIFVRGKSLSKLTNTKTLTKQAWKQPKQCMYCKENPSKLAATALASSLIPKN